MKIQNVTISQYLSGNHKEEIDYVLKYGKWNEKIIDVFEFGDFTNQQFGFVKDAQSLFKDYVTIDNYVDFIIENGIDKKEVLKRGILEIYSSLLYMRDQIDSINQLESNNLSHGTTSEEEAAGIDRFNKYGADLQYSALAGGDDYESKERVKRWPYNYCFMVLLKQKDTREFEKDLFNIRNRKK